MRTSAVDADAHGLDILHTYKLGSAGMAYAAEQLKLPTIRWLGVRQSDLTSFGVSSRCLLPLTTNDKRMAQRLLSAPDKLAQVHPAAHAELTAMVKSGTKAEIECLHTVPGGLVKYLQTKLAAALKTTDSIPRLLNTAFATDSASDGDCIFIVSRDTFVLLTVKECGRLPMWMMNWKHTEPCDRRTNRVE